MSKADNPKGTERTENDATVIQPQVQKPAGLGDTASFSPNPQAGAAPAPAEQESQLIESTTTPSLARRRAAAKELPDQFGRYRIERPLGKGAMGAVYLALDTQLDRQVALKVPFFDDSSDSDLIDRFYREARSMATLHHPNLCPVYDVGEIDGVHYLTMAYVAGRSLADVLRDAARLSDRQVATLIMKLALALDSAHQAGIVHRDLKPANIMIRPDGEPVIMDFGLARRQKEGEAHLTHSGMLLGTPAYMSPEQVGGRTELVGAASDVYALGVILYQFLAGKLPFDGSVGSVMAAIIHQQPLPPHEVCAAGVNQELESICLKAMAKSIEQRYRSARELADELKRLLRGSLAQPASKAITSPAESPPQRRQASPEIKVQSAPRAKQGARKSETNPRSPGRRFANRRVWIAGAGGVVAVLAAVIYFSFSRGVQVNSGGDLAGPVQSATASLPATAGSHEPLSADPFTPRPDAPDQSWRLPPEPRRFPSLDDTISHPPPWLIADKQPPFDLVRYFEVPVWEDNAAPAYLKAFFEFSAEVYRCFPESSREQQRQIAFDRQQRFFDLENKWAVNHQSVSDEQFEVLLPDFETGFALLRQAQRKRECVFEIGAGLGLLLPHVQSARYVARVEAHRARRDLREGRIDDLLPDVALVMRVVHDVNSRGCAITFAAACATDQAVCDEVLRPILLHPQLTQEQCRRVIAMLRDHELQKDNVLRQALQGEYVVLRVTLHDFQYRVGSFSRDFFRSFAPDPQNVQPPQTAGEAMAVVLSMMAAMNDLSSGVTLGDTIDKVRVAQRIDAMTDAEYDREVTFANASFQSLVTICNQPVWERLRLFSKIHDQSSRNQESRIVRYLALPDRLVQFDRRNRTQLAGLVCLACLRSWQFDHAEPPNSLESLMADAGVDDLIPDPYGTGEPLRLVKIDGQPVIYSVGGDEYDDGGKKEWNLKDEGSGDMTFRLETIEALRQRRAAQ